MDVKVQKTSELGRELTVTVPAGTVAQKVLERLEKIGQQTKIRGFRPGKVPQKVLKQRYGAQVCAELRQDLVSETMADAFDQENLSPATQPNIDFGQVEETQDYIYKMVFDVLPEIKPKGYKGAKLTKNTAKVADGQVTEALERLAKSVRTFDVKKGKAEKGDSVVLNAQGRDAKSKEEIQNAVLTKHTVELGSGALIPGFEEGLEGHKAGDKFDVKVTFPKDYHAKDLAGVKAIFAVELLEVKEASTPKIDDSLATQFGMKDLAELKEKITEQIARDVTEASRQQLKRALFDVLEKENKFTLPEAMVDQEFASIWKSLQEDMKRAQTTFESMDKTEDELRAEHRTLAERRVRVGLVLAEIGKIEKIQVGAEELRQAAQAKAAQYPKEYAEKAMNYYLSNQGRQEIFGPIFEEKVCDWVFENATITEKEMDADKLLQELNV